MISVVDTTKTASFLPGVEKGSPVLPDGLTC